MKQQIAPKGFNYDLPAEELGLDVWNGGRNVIFKDGSAQAAPGWFDVQPAPLLGRPLWLLPFQTDTVIYWIYGGNSLDGLTGFLGVTDGTNDFDITPVAGLNPGVAGDWTGGILNGVPFMNAVGNVPMFWDGNTANVAEPLPGWPAGYLCQAMRPYKVYLIAMDIDDNGVRFGDLVIWSDAADPGSVPNEWVPTPDNDAGNFTISATPGILIDGGQMRDLFVLYKTHSTTIMSFIAGNFIFSQRKAFVTSGILARNCYEEYRGKHYVLTDGDVIEHNGQEIQSLVDGRMRNFLFRQLDNEAFYGACITASHSEKQLWVCFPQTGSTYNSQALVIDILTSTIGLSDLPDIPFMDRGILNTVAPETWDTLTFTWMNWPGQWFESLFNPNNDTLVMASPESPNLLAHGGNSRLGEPVEVLLQMLSKDFGDNTQFKTLNTIWTDVTGASVLTGENAVVRVGFQNGIKDAISWQSPAPKSPGYDKHDMMISGRYISLELSGGQTLPWFLHRQVVEYEVNGLY